MLIFSAIKVRPNVLSQVIGWQNNFVNDVITMLGLVLLGSGQEVLMLMAPSKMIASSRLRKISIANTRLLMLTFRKGFFLLLCPVLQAWRMSFYGFSLY